MHHQNDATDAFGLLPVPQSKVRFSGSLREQNEQRLTSDARSSATLPWTRSSSGKVILVLVVALMAALASARVSFALRHFR
jgi:hypothetical protein